MTWDEICEDPNLRDLPSKIETNQRGQIIMGPARSRRGEYQYRIGTWLEKLLPQGRILIECPVQTASSARGGLNGQTLRPSGFCSVTPVIFHAPFSFESVYW